VAHPDGGDDPNCEVVVRNYGAQTLRGAIALGNFKNENDVELLRSVSWRDKVSSAIVAAQGALDRHIGCRASAVYGW
jgi:hypothetical protein